MIKNLLSCQAALYLSELERVDLDHLRAAPLPAHDPDRLGRHVEKGGQQADERLVRAPPLGRRRDAHLPTVAVPPDELGSRRARRDRDANPSR